MATKTATPRKSLRQGRKAAKTETPKTAPKKAAAKKDIAAGYNQYKLYGGQQYTGMKVGRTHNWNYDNAEWKEKKVTPEQWEFSYAAIKRRRGKAPESSGVPVGTCYHWFILAHQYAEKLNADDYLTTMVGLKYKLSHKRAGKDKLNVTDNTQRKELIKILKGMVNELEKEPESSAPVRLNFEYKGKVYKGDGIPVMSSCDNGVCTEMDITLNQKHMGIIRCSPKGWKMTDVPQGLVNAIGDQVFHWYE
jgi:hypothetical protein